MKYQAEIETSRTVHLQERERERETSRSGAHNNWANRTHTNAVPALLIGRLHLGLKCRFQLSDTL